MPDLPSFQDLFRAARDEAMSRNPLLTLDAIQRDGSDANVLVASAAGMGDEVMAQLAQSLASLFLDSAAGDDLDRLVFDRYGLVRKAASPAVVTIRFTTTAPTPGPFTIAQGTLLQTASGVQFITTSPSTVFPGGGTGPVDLAARSTLAGSSQQTQIGTITSIVSVVPGSPSDLRATNPLASAGAGDAESDDSLRDRARRFFSTVRRGTASALIAGALATPGVVRASVFESVGSVELVIADAYTDTLAQLATVPPSYQTQAVALSTAVDATLVDYRAAGIRVTVTVAQVVMQPIQILLTFFAGADVVTVAKAARDAMVAYTNGLAPGQPWVVADAIAALRSVGGLVVSGSDVLSPVGDVSPTGLQVIRTSPNLVVAATP